MKSENKIKITALVVTVLFLASLGVMVYHVNVNDVLKKDLTTEKLKGEKLLSEKLNLDKQIASIKESLTAMQGKNAQLDKLLQEAKGKLSEREKTIGKLHKDNASLASFKKEHDLLKKLQENLQAQIASLTLSNKQLNEQLNAKEQLLASLRKENIDLLAKYNKLEQDRIFADNFRIESMKKKNEKLTVRAGKTKNIAVSFDVPVHLANNAGDRTFRLELTKPIGAEVRGEQKIAYFDVEDNTLTASMEAYPVKSAKRATISFMPTEKLKQGVYVISICEGNELIGNAQIRLMK